MQKRIDLHGMTSHDAEVEISMQFYSLNNSDNHITSLKIVFGKGGGILRQSVIAAVHKEGYSFTELNPGAIVVDL